MGYGVLVVGGIGRLGWWGWWCPVVRRGPGYGPGRLVVVVSQGGLGKGVLVTNRGGLLSRRELFDAATPFLPGFEPKASFVF